MNKYLQAVSANFIFLALNTIFFLVITPLAIGIMGAEFYGLWTILYAIALFSNVGTLGITAITNKFSAEFSSDSETHTRAVLTSGFLIIAVMAVLVSAVLFLTRGMIAASVETSPKIRSELSLAILWIAWGILPQFLAKVIQGYFLSQYQNSFVRTLDFLGNSLPWVGAVLLFRVDPDLVTLAAWFFGVQVVILLVYVFMLQVRVRFRFEMDKKVFRAMFGFSRYMFLESVAIALFQQFDRILVGFLLGPATAGVYAVGTSLGLRLPIVTGQATEVMIPYASSKDSLGDHPKLYETFRKLARYTGMLAAGIGILLILFMDLLLALWISPEYSIQYSAVFRIIILAYTLLSMVRAGHQTLTGLGQVRFTSLTYLAGTLAMLLALGLLAGQWGLLGAAVANLSMVFLLIFDLKVYRSISSGGTWGHILQDLGLPIMLSLLAYGLSLLHLSTLHRAFILALLWSPLIVKVMRDKVFRNQIRDIIRSERFRSLL